MHSSRVTRKGRVGEGVKVEDRREGKAAQKAVKKISRAALVRGRIWTEKSAPMGRGGEER